MLSHLFTLCKCINFVYACVNMFVCTVYSHMHVCTCVNHVLHLLQITLTNCSKMLCQKLKTST